MLKVNKELCQMFLFYFTKFNAACRVEKVLIENPISLNVFFSNNMEITVS